MKTELAKAIEAGEDVVGKEVVLLTPKKYYYLDTGRVYTISAVVEGFLYFSGSCVCASVDVANDFEFKHVLDKQKEDEPVVRFPDYNHSAVFLYYDKIMSMKEQLEGALEINKQYEQQLFDLRMENARLELAAQRWEMFNCEANRNIADKLLKKLADEQGE